MINFKCTKIHLVVNFLLMVFFFFFFFFLNFKLKDIETCVVQEYAISDITSTVTTIDGGNTIILNDNGFYLIKRKDNKPWIITPDTFISFEFKGVFFFFFLTINYLKQKKKKKDVAPEGSGFYFKETQAWQHYRFFIVFYLFIFEGLKKKKK